MFWGVLIGVLAAGVFGASIMLDGIDLMAMYTEMGIGVGIGVGTAAAIFALGAGVVSAMDYARKRNAS
jgi:ribosomal protein L27